MVESDPKEKVLRRRRFLAASALSPTLPLLFSPEGHSEQPSEVTPHISPEPEQIPDLSLQPDPKLYLTDINRLQAAKQRIQEKEPDAINHYNRLLTESNIIGQMKCVCQSHN